MAGCGICPLNRTRPRSMSPLFRTVSTGQVIMRRRVFLTAALGATAGAGALSLSGCADVRQRIARTLTPQPPTVLHASLSTLPKAPSIPTDFGGEAVWPLRVKENQNHPWPTNAMIETAHGSFLIAYDVNSDDDDTAALSGDRPIIVDLNGPKTYTLVPDDSEHGYRIEPMTVPQVGGVPQEAVSSPAPAHSSPSSSPALPPATTSSPTSSPAARTSSTSAPRTGDESVCSRSAWPTAASSPARCSGRISPSRRGSRPTAPAPRSR